MTPSKPFKAEHLFAILLVIAVAAGVSWWCLPPPVRGEIPMDLGSEVLKDTIVGLPSENCWRKEPQTEEMVCNYKDDYRIYSVRFVSGSITEVVRDAKLGGPDKPPFTHLVDSP